MPMHIFKCCQGKAYASQTSASSNIKSSFAAAVNGTGCCHGNILLLFLMFGEQVVFGAVCIAASCTAAPMLIPCTHHCACTSSRLQLHHQHMQTAPLFAVTTATLLVAAALASVHAHCFTVCCNHSYPSGCSCASINACICSLFP